MRRSQFQAQSCTYFCLVCVLWICALLSRFSTWRICSREQRKKQLDWLVTNTDDITSQSHSLFACSREQIRQVENRLYWHFLLSVCSYAVFRCAHSIACARVQIVPNKSQRVIHTYVQTLFNHAGPISDICWFPWGMLEYCTTLDKAPQK